MQSGPVTSPDPASMVPGTILAGRYRLERAIGSGGFGTVFAAVNLNSSERVALKVLSPRVLEMSGGAERFRREAELARRLTHPNIVRVLDAGMDPGGALFIAFELLEGRSLQDEISHRGAFAPRRAVNVCAEVLAALEHAHAHGVVHRDLKPANVFLLGGANEGAVKVLDFGIAKSTNPGTRAGLTQDGTAIGTPAYMAPEQLEGGDIRPATDVFSLGVVLAEMLAGKPLFDEGASAIQIITTRLTRGLPIPDSVSRSPLGPIVARATETDPARRFADARQMRGALDSVSGQLPYESFTTGPRVAVGPTALGGAPTAAHVGITAPSPGWAPAVPVPPGMLPGVPPPSPPRAGGSAVPLIVAVLFGLAAVSGGAAYFLSVKKHDARAAREADEDRDEDADDRPRKKKKRVTEEDDEVPTDKPALPPPDRPKPPRPDPEPVRPPQAPPVSLGRAQPCSGIPLAPVGLRANLTQAGFEVTGKLLYCAGDMVNFQCLGPRGDGFTVEGGSAALMKLGSAAEAEAFARKEAASAKGEQTYVWDAGRVVRIEMKAADADRLLKKMCKT